MQSKKNNSTSIEKSLVELEKIVNEMESGKLPLADSLKLFERGIKIVRAVEEQLTQTKQKIYQLTKDNKLHILDE